MTDITKMGGKELIELLVWMQRLQKKLWPSERIPDYESYNTELLRRLQERDELREAISELFSLDEFVGTTADEMNLADIGFGYALEFSPEEYKKFLTVIKKLRQAIAGTTGEGK